MIEDTSYSFKPGIHSHNFARRAAITPVPSFNIVGKLRIVLGLVGLLCLGYYAYTLADQRIYQNYENWAFDQQITGRAAVTFRDYVRETTPFGFLAGPREAVTTVPTRVTAGVVPPPANGSVIGRVAIGRLNLSAVVRQGVDADTLSNAVGHVPSSALPGQAGNFAIAAHRDTLFRALKDIQKGDVVTFQSPSRLFTYEVKATKIVKPTDISVLHSDGGGLIPPASGKTPDKLLTMITCYPFYFVGSAPKRFVVEAELVDDTETRAANQRER